MTASIKERDFNTANINSPESSYKIKFANIESLHELDNIILDAIEDMAQRPAEQAEPATSIEPYSHQDPPADPNAIIDVYRSEFTGGNIYADAQNREFVCNQLGVT